MFCSRWKQPITANALRCLCHRFVCAPKLIQNKQKICISIRTMNGVKYELMKHVGTFSIFNKSNALRRQNHNGMNDGDEGNVNFILFFSFVVFCSCTRVSVCVCWKLHYTLVLVRSIYLLAKRNFHLSTRQTSVRRVFTYFNFKSLLKSLDFTANACVFVCVPLNAQHKSDWLHQKKM